MKGFADIGYIDDKTVVLEHRFPNEQPAQLRTSPPDVALGVDVLVVIGADAPPYAKEATKTIPVVFALMPGIRSAASWNRHNPRAAVGFSWNNLCVGHVGLYWKPKRGQTC